MDYERLSRTIAHALRHEPWVYELEIDEEGWAPLDQLLEALRTKRSRCSSLGREDLEEMMRRSDRRRYEIRGDRVRALYGHSPSGELSREPARPPERLYHGTSPGSVSAIRREGHRPMGRQHVHLSVDRPARVPGAGRMSAGGAGSGDVQPPRVRRPLPPAGGAVRAWAVGVAAALALAVAGCGGEPADGGDAGPGADGPEAGAVSDSPAASDSAPGDGPADAGTAAGDDWPTYGGVPAATRYSRLAEVDSGNVDGLERAWEHRTGVDGVFEATPLVVDGEMYLSTPVAGGRQQVEKLDAATGELIWETTLEIGPARPDPTTASRGVAVHEGRVFVATLDARLVALDAEDGSKAWEVRTADPSAGYQHKQAPLAHDGRVYLGVSGGPLGIRGFVKAFDADDGSELWTWHSIPSPGEGGWWGEWRETLSGTDVDLGRDVAAERADSARYADAWRRGGGAVWMTPTLEPDRGEGGRLYVAVGNPAPELNGDVRPGDNRWTSSVCAVDAAEGSVAWCRQYLPHDVWGMDAASPPFLFPHGPRGRDAGAGGAGADGPTGTSASGDADARPAVGHFSKLGFFYAWDRRDGERLVLSDPYVPQENFLARPDGGSVRMAPGIYGGTEWSPAAWSPRTGFAYAPSLHAPGRYVRRGDGSLGFDLGPASERHGLMVAVAPATGEVAWTDRTERPLVGGALATAGGLVFAGRLSGALTAWDAGSGERLWSGGTDHGCASGPITYRADGRQYVAVACGGHFFGGGRGDQVVAWRLPADDDGRGAGEP